MLSIDALSQTPTFLGIARETLALVWALGETTRHEVGEKLFDRGDEAHHLLVLESGAVDLFFPVPVLGAVKEIVVERIGSGDVLAWSALVSPFALTLSARCVQACAVRRFARDRLRPFLRAHPDVGRTLMENLAGVIGHRLHHFQELWIREVQTRIVGMLG